MNITINEKSYDITIPGANGARWHKAIREAVESLGYDCQESKIFIPDYVAGEAANERGRYMIKSAGRTQLGAAN